MQFYLFSWEYFLAVHLLVSFVLIILVTLNINYEIIYLNKFSFTIGAPPVKRGQI